MNTAALTGTRAKTKACEPSVSNRGEAHDIDGGAEPTHYTDRLYRIKSKFILEELPCGKSSILLFNITTGAMNINLRET